jgi:hypothetical protein
MATHRLQLTYDDATDTLTVTHRCAVEVGGQTVSHAEEVPLENPAAVAAAFKGLLQANAKAMEERTADMAARHVAAVQRKPAPGLKTVQTGGSLGALGAGAPKQKG